MKKNLPIDCKLENIYQIYRQHNNFILTAAPGSGKTTRWPAYLLRQHLDQNNSGMIIVLQPRRISAVSACQYIRNENPDLTDLVGYEVRWDKSLPAPAQLIFMTEAIFLKKILNNSFLDQVHTVIFDEFHERTLYSDVLVSFLFEQQCLGSSLKIMIMSATLEAHKLKKFLQAEHLSIEVNSFNLTSYFHKKNLIAKLDPSFYKEILDKIKYVTTQTQGDILVFLPGVKEILKIQTELKSQLDWDSDCIQILHGQMDLAQQGQILQKTNQQRIILSTNIAESSVTVQGVRAVIDSGLEKISRWNYKTGYTELILQKISLFSSRQRSGRAHREGDGLYFKMWSEVDEQTLALSPEPDIEKADPSEVMLFLYSQNIPDLKSFSWLQPPPEKHLEVAHKNLLRWQAICHQKKMTKHGWRLLSCPLGLAESHLLWMSHELNMIEIGVKIVSLLQDSKALHKTNQTTSIPPIFENDLEHSWHLRSKIEDQLQSYLRHHNIIVSTKSINFDHEKIQNILLLSWPERLGRRKNGSQGITALQDGSITGVTLDKSSCVKKERFFIILHAFKNNDEWIVTLACALDENKIWLKWEPYLKQKNEIIFVEDKKDFYQKTVTYLFDFPLKEGSLNKVQGQSISPLMSDYLEKNWNWSLQQNKDFASLWEKIIFATHYCNTEPWKDLWQKFKNEQKNIIQKFLEQLCYNKTSLQDLVQEPWCDYFLLHLPKDLVMLLQQDLPSTLLLPMNLSHKKTVPIHYTLEQGALVHVKIQEVLGWRNPPKVLSRSYWDEKNQTPGMPLTFFLLAPNQRAVQITKNLADFWSGSYIEIRKELKARYPKHSWPEKI